MGIHDRDYMQAGPTSGPLYRPGRLTWLIIAINGVLWLVYSSSLNNARTMTESEAEASLFVFMADQLMLWPDFVFGAGKVWQLFTSFWMHSPGGAQHVLMNMLMLFFFGRAVESFLGPKRFLALYLGAGVFASLIYVLWSFLVGSHVPALGASGAVYAVLVWMALQRPKATVYLMMVIPVPMWLAVGVLMVGVELFAFAGDVAGTKSDVSHVAHLAGAAFGAAFWFFLPRFAAARRHAPARPTTPQPPRDYQAPSDLEEAHRRTAMRMEMDRLLDKVHAEGIDRLTDEEKTFLERASRELRGR
ncbi:MAG: rhomboid family intramembrane serine protease [Planctomycetota bacterium]|nr:rhomboid family intramembrane serine protease [Planctomycetota bacterium]